MVILRYMKYVFLFLLSFVAIVLVVGLFTPKTYAVTKTIEVDKEAEFVFNYFKQLKNQDNYSVWSTLDSNMKKSYSGNDATVGFVSRWESKVSEVGTGEQEIAAIEQGKRIDYVVRFIEPFTSSYNCFLQADKINDDKTLVTWGLSGEMNYPTNLFLLFMNMEDLLGKNLQLGLSNLKVVLE